MADLNIKIAELAPINIGLYQVGKTGENGKEVELQNNTTHIQWRYTGDLEWTDLVPLSELTGANGLDGKNIELQTNLTHIQWRVVGDETWIDLIALSTFKGDKGDKGDDGLTISVNNVTQIDGNVSLGINDILVDNQNILTDDELAVVQSTSNTNTGDETTETIQNKLGIDTVIGDPDKHLNQKGDWTMIEPPAGGYANNLYFGTVDSDIPTYKVLTYTPDVAETIYTNTVALADGEKTLLTYIYPTAVTVDTFPSGLWSFNFYGNVDSASQITQLGITYFKRSMLGVETDLFTSWSNEINNITDEWIQWQITNPSYSLDPTDRMGARIKVRTTKVSAITITYKIGDGYGAYLNNPNKIRHSQLRDLNGDVNYLHATSVEKSTWNAKQDAGDYLTSDDEIPSSPLPRDADTLGGYTSALLPVSIPVQSQFNIRPSNVPIRTYTHSGNKSVAIATNAGVDVANNKFIKTAHGLVNGDIIYIIPNSDSGAIYPLDTYPSPLALSSNGYTVTRINDNEFSLNSTTLTSNANLDVTKWHFESRTVSVTISSLPPRKKYKLIIRGQSLRGNGTRYISPNAVSMSIGWFAIGGINYAPATVGYSSFDIWIDVTVLIDFSSKLNIKQKGFTIQTNTTTRNTMTEVDNCLFNNILSDTDITSIDFTNSYFANGATIEVYDV